MRDSKLDRKNVGLAKLLYRLRQDIDLYRVITLNGDSLMKRKVGLFFWAHIQWLAHQSVAVGICKMFEREKTNDLNSIPGIIGLLPARCEPAQRLKVNRFARRFGVVEEWTDVRQYLLSVLDGFSNAHAAEMSKLRRFRDKFGVHSEHGATLKPLPSIAEFEALFEFGDAFYRLVSDVFIDVAPAPISAEVAVSATRVMECLGLENPKLDFK